MQATLVGELVRIIWSRIGLETRSQKAEVVRITQDQGRSLSGRTSKAWTPFELKLPVFYRELLA